MCDEKKVYYLEEELIDDLKKENWDRIYNEIKKEYF